MGKCRGWLLAGVAMAALASPMSIGAVRAGDPDDGFAALAALMGVAAAAAVEKVRIDDKAFIDQCTEDAIAKWRGRDVSVNTLFEGQRLEDECVGEAVAMEVGRLREEEAAREAREKAAADEAAAKDKAAWAEAEAISDRLKAARDAKQVVAASGPVARAGSLKGRRRVEYLANGSMRINW